MPARHGCEFAAARSQAAVPAIRTSNPHSKLLLLEFKYLTNKSEEPLVATWRRPWSARTGPPKNRRRGRSVARTRGCCCSSTPSRALAAGLDRAVAAQMSSTPAVTGRAAGARFRRAMPRAKGPAPTAQQRCARSATLAFERNKPGRRRSCRRMPTASTSVTAAIGRLLALVLFKRTAAAAPAATGRAAGARLRRARPRPKEPAPTAQQRCATSAALASKRGTPGRRRSCQKTPTAYTSVTAAIRPLLTLVVPNRTAAAAPAATGCAAGARLRRAKPGKKGAAPTALQRCATSAALASKRGTPGRRRSRGRTPTACTSVTAAIRLFLALLLSVITAAAAPAATGRAAGARIGRARPRAKGPAPTAQQRCARSATIASNRGTPGRRRSCR
jgi:hypothetical protein